MKNTYPTKFWIAFGAVLLLASFAICVGLGYIAIGQEGIKIIF